MTQPAQSTFVEFQKIIHSSAMSVFLLTMISFVTDIVLFHRIGAFFHSFGYSLILLIYALGWYISLLWGRGVTVFFLVLNFIAFCVFKEYYKVNIDVLNWYAIVSAGQEGIRAGFMNYHSLLDGSFIGVGLLTVVGMVWVIKHSFYRPKKAMFIMGISLILTLVLKWFGVWKWLSLGLFLFPNLYTAYERGLLYKITFPVEMTAPNPMIELNQLIKQGNQDIIQSYQQDDVFLSKMPKHIYLIQVESLTTLPLQDNIMPFLSSLRTDKNTLFIGTDKQHYHCLGSANTDFMMMTGIDLNCQKNRTMMYFKYPHTIYQTSITPLPARLKQYGYETRIYHGFEGMFFNRLKHYPSMGFDKVFFMEQFPKRYKRHDWGISDKDVLTASALQTRTDKKTFSFIITASTHPPYQPQTTQTVFDTQIDDEERLNYLRVFHEFDKAMEQFYHYLPEDSLIILYGDHNTPEVGDDALDTPLMIWYKGQNKPTLFGTKQDGFRHSIYFINSLFAKGEK